MQPKTVTCTIWKFGLCWRFACIRTIHSGHLIRTTISELLQLLLQQGHRISLFLLIYFQDWESGNPLLRNQSFSPLDKSNYAVHLININKNISALRQAKRQLQCKYIGHEKKMMLTFLGTTGHFSGWEAFLDIFIYHG